MVPQECGYDERSPKLIFYETTFMDVKNTLEDCFSFPGASSLMYLIGKGCGLRFYRRLKNASTSDYLKTFIDYKREEGWGEFRFELGNGPGKIYLRGGFESRGSISSSEPVCNFTKGFIEGFLSGVFRKNLKLKETACAAKGDPECIFEVLV